MLSGVDITPSFWAAKCVDASTSEFDRNVATRWPGRTPLATNACAIWFVLVSHSR
jgi:hypothetical protein